MDMYDKILQLLKKAAGQNPAITQKTLEDQAKLAANFIATEEQLASYDAKSVIDTIQGNINHYMKDFSEKQKKEQEKLAKENAAKEKADKEEADRKKALENDSETPAWAKTMMEQNRIQAEVNKKLADDLLLIKQDKVTATRTNQLDLILEGLPAVVKTPIQESFKTAKFESDESFEEYLETMKTTTATFMQEAREKGITIPSPKPNIKKKEELNGQSPVLKGALDMVESEKQKNEK